MVSARLALRGIKGREKPDHLQGGLGALDPLVANVATGTVNGLLQRVTG